MMQQGFALIGRAFESEAFDALRQAATAARRARGGAWDADMRPRPAWRGSGKPVAPPPRKR